MENEKEKAYDLITVEVEFYADANSGQKKVNKIKEWIDYKLYTDDCGNSLPQDVEFSIGKAKVEHKYLEEK